MTVTPLTKHRRNDHDKVHTRADPALRSGLDAPGHVADFLQVRSVPGAARRRDGRRACNHVNRTCNHVNRNVTTKAINNNVTGT